MPGLQDGATSTKKILRYFAKHSSNNKNHRKQKRNIPVSGSDNILISSKHLILALFIKFLQSKVKYSLQLTNIWHEDQLTGQSPPFLSVDSGQTIALVGPDFARNSTVLSLVEKIDSSAPKTLLLDDMDSCELDTAWLKRQIGIVSRYPVLFNMSVRDNIRYGANFRYVSEEEVISVAKEAGVHDILCSLPKVRIIRL